MEKEGKLNSMLLIQDVEELKERLTDGTIDMSEVSQIIVQEPSTEISDLVKNLVGLKLYVIVPKPDKNLEKMNIVGLDYYAVDPIEVTDINLTADPDNILFNGSVKMPKKGVDDATLIGTYFTDEAWANEMCTQLNEATNRRIENFTNMLNRTLKMRKKIVAENLG